MKLINHIGLYTQAQLDQAYVDGQVSERMHSTQVVENLREIRDRAERDHKVTCDNYCATISQLHSEIERLNRTISQKDTAHKKEIEKLKEKFVRNEEETAGAIHNEQKALADLEIRINDNSRISATNRQLKKSLDWQQSENERLEKSINQYKQDIVKLNGFIDKQSNVIADTIAELKAANEKHDNLELEYVKEKENGIMLKKMLEACADNAKQKKAGKKPAEEIDRESTEKIQEAGETFFNNVVNASRKRRKPKKGVD